MFHAGRFTDKRIHQICNSLQGSTKRPHTVGKFSSVMGPGLAR
jgi:hypothetical protein